VCFQKRNILVPWWHYWFIASRPDLIDSALLRPGRLDKSLLCNLPTAEERQDVRQVNFGIYISWLPFLVYRFWKPFQESSQLQQMSISAKFPTRRKVSLEPTFKLSSITLNLRSFILPFLTLRHSMLGIPPNKPLWNMLLFLKVNQWWPRKRKGLWSGEWVTFLTCDSNLLMPRQLRQMIINSSSSKGDERKQIQETPQQVIGNHKTICLIT